MALKKDNFISSNQKKIKLKSILNEKKSKVER